MRDADQWVFHRHNDSVDATPLSVSIAATNTVSRQGPSDTLHNSAACHFSQVSFLSGVISLWCHQSRSGGGEESRMWYE